tara:strand:- start:941 stop:1135 length:195 start_codon:yes stop_codon:yes gene_type:complete
MNQKERDEFMSECVDELMNYYSYQYSTSRCFGALIDELMKFPDMTIRDFFERYEPEPEEEEDEE